MIRSWIIGILIIFSGAAALYIVYELTASAKFDLGQATKAEQHETGYQTCFTPDEDCEAVIVRTINAASRRIHMQAYLFTDKAIARALKDAARRGLEVIVLVDKREESEQNSVAPALAEAGVRVLLDDRPAIAHNKTIIIDPDGASPMVETGSFNFTYDAEHRNAENVLIIRNARGLAAAYERYFRERLTASEPWKRGE